MNTFKHITAYYNDEEYNNMKPRIEKLMKKLDVDNHTDLLNKLVEGEEMEN